jgi:hypothetical protein
MESTVLEQPVMEATVSHNRNSFLVRFEMRLLTLFPRYDQPAG